METKKFKTRSIYKEMPHPVKRDDTWYIALDMGYSAVKGMSPNAVFCFPSYARKMDRDTVEFAKPSDDDILYRDLKTGDIYAVGAKAIALISIESTDDSESTLYGRNRYFSEIFNICSKVGLALGMNSNEFGSPEGKKLVLQTGLPPKYLETDADIIREAFIGDYDFELKIGKGNWVRYTFSLTEDNIYVMSQPMGTLVSVAIDKDGKSTPDAERIYKSNTLVFDPGFRTTDTCLLKGQGGTDKSSYETITGVSMLVVLQKTSDAIMKRYGERIPVPAIQPYLESGKVKHFDPKKLKSTLEDFSEILEEKNKEVCEIAIDKLCEIYNTFREIDYLILTGGTGAAWSEIIREKLKDLETLTIISGNRNEELPHLFSNVRGYYYYIINRA